jgi:hypothetical protein
VSGLGEQPLASLSDPHIVALLWAGVPLRPGLDAVFIATHTGMYRVEGTWRPVESLSVRAWDGYWDEEAQGLGGIDFIQIDPDARLGALQAGDIDMVVVDPPVVSAVESAPGLEVRVDSTNEMRMFIYNETLEPFDDLRVRQALHHSIDRRAATEALTLGFAETAWGYFPEGHWAYDPDLVDYYEFALPFNPKEHERMHGVVLLAVFAFNIMADMRPLAIVPGFENLNWFDAMNDLVGRLLLPLAGLITVIFVGWIADRRLVDAETGLDGARLRLWRFLIAWLCPLAVASILIASLFPNLIG